MNTLSITPPDDWHTCTCAMVQRSQPPSLTPAGIFAAAW
jgi:hypothetical protein